MLRLAARHADIISVVPVTTRSGKGLLSGITLEKTIEKVELIRTAAGDRFAEIELNWAITAIVITDDRQKTAAMALSAIADGLHPNLEVDVDLSVEDILSSPYVAIGTHEQIADQLREVRRLPPCPTSACSQPTDGRVRAGDTAATGDDRHLSVT